MDLTSGAKVKTYFPRLNFLGDEETNGLYLIAETLQTRYQCVNTWKLGFR